MNLTQRTFHTAIKSGGLATVLTIFTFYDEVVHAPLIIISYIGTITTIIAIIMISMTIVPLCYISNETQMHKIFEQFFPYYIMIFAGVCFYFYLQGDLPCDINHILSIAFITASQAWLWFFKSDSSDILDSIPNGK